LRFGIDRLQACNQAVTPAQAGVRKTAKVLDSRFRGNNIKKDTTHFFSNLLIKVIQSQQAQW